MSIAKNNKAVTLVELIIAMAIMVIIMAAIAPQFRAIRKSWATSEASSNLIQNSRVLQEHITRNLSSAREIVSVSADSVNLGFIIFKDSNDIEKRYMVSGGYVLFGDLGSEEQLAGPVSKFQVSSFSLDDFDTATTDANNIRLVEVETIFPHDTGTDRTFITSAYLRTNVNAECDIVAHWKLDDGSGTTAADSSGNGNDGTLTNGPSWTTGIIGGGLEFDGWNDYVNCGSGASLDITGDITIALWLRADNFWWEPDIITKGSYSSAYSVWLNSSGNVIFSLNNDRLTSNTAISTDEWHHIAVTRGASTRKIYIDGQEDDSDSYSSAIATTGWPLTISTTGYPFNGTMDDIRIYDRELSAEEIEQLATTLRYVEPHTEDNASSDTTFITIDTPAADEDDLLIAAVATDGSTSFPTQSGWTEIDQGSNGTAVTLGAWYKIAGSSEPPNYTFTWSGSQQAYGWMMRFSGQNSASPIEACDYRDDTSDEPISPSVTTSVNNCIILRLGAFDNDDITEDDTGLPDHTDITMDESASGTTGLVGYWNMDESSGTTATDSSDGGRNGTLVNGPTWVTGKVGNAVNLDGYNDYVSLPIGPLISSLTNCTIAAWVKWDTDDGDDWHRIWDFGTGTTYYMYLVIDNGNSHTPQFTITTHGSGNDEDTIAPSSLSFNTWHHIAITINAATHTHKMYINGSYVAQNTSGYLDPHDLGNTNKNYLGRSNYSDDPYFNGKMDDIRIYNYVLSSTEISQLYQWTGGGSGDTVSGGAGYVKQATAGSSGESNFSLNSSQAARTLTIAITPADTTDDDCSGGVTP